MLKHKTYRVKVEQEVLITKTKGCTPMAKKNQDPKEVMEIEGLREQIAFLKMENTALKMKALVQEEEARRTGSRHK